MSRSNMNRGMFYIQIALINRHLNLKKIRKFRICLVFKNGHLNEEKHKVGQSITCKVTCSKSDLVKVFFLRAIQGYSGKTNFSYRFTTIFLVIIVKYYELHPIYFSFIQGSVWKPMITLKSFFAPCNISVRHFGYISLYKFSFCLFYFGNKTLNCHYLTKSKRSQETNLILTHDSHCFH